MHVSDAAVRAHVNLVNVRRPSSPKRCAWVADQFRSAPIRRGDMIVKQVVGTPARTTAGTAA
jgi:CxxC motif-containing protein